MKFCCLAHHFCSSCLWLMLDVSCSFDEHVFAEVLLDCFGGNMWGLCFICSGFLMGVLGMRECQASKLLW